MRINIDAKTAKKVIASAFGGGIDTNDMVVAECEANREVKLFNDNILYSVSAITAKRTIDDCARWMYSVLCSDGSASRVTWKYVHPITNAAYDDPEQVNFETLPFAA